MTGVIGVIVTSILWMKEYQLARLKGFLHPEQYSLSEGYYPFVSYGTAYMIVNSFMMGIILGVYRKKNLILLAER